MHETLLVALDELDGTGTTTQVLKYMKVTPDNSMYSAFDYFERQGNLSKEKSPTTGRNTWTITPEGYELLNNTDNTLSFKKYDKYWLDFRKKEKKKSPQKDLLHQPVNKVKKEPAPPMPNMSEAATAAVEGIAKVIDRDQKSHAFIVQLHRMCEDYINSQK